MRAVQFVCGRSKAVFSVLFLLSATYLFSMEQEETTPTLTIPGPKEPECTSRAVVKEMVDSILQERLRTCQPEMHQPKMQPSERSVDYLKYYSKQQLEEAYEQAPRGVKILLKRLQHPEFELTDPDIRAAFFQGVPGTGKTRAAVMLAYKMGWAFIMKRATKCTEGHRGGATVNLRQLLDSMVAPEPDGSEVPTIGILDEAEEILEHAGDTHYDTASTSREFGGFLEDQRNNKNFFLVPTMNKCDTFQEMVKSRMKGKRIIFEIIIDPRSKVLAFLQKISTDNIVVDCDEQFLLDTVGQMKECVGRDIRSLAGAARDEAIGDSDLDGIVEVLPKHVLAAIDKMAKDEKDFKCGEEEETASQMRKKEFEQREQHHSESIKLNLLSQTRQKSQVTGGGSLGVNGGINLGGGSVGGGSVGGNLGGSVSMTSSPGMSEENAEKTWKEVRPDADEPLFGQDKERGGRGNLLERRKLLKDLEEMRATRRKSAYATVGAVALVACIIQ